MSFGRSLIITSPGRTGSHWLLFMLEELLGISRYKEKTFQHESSLGKFVEYLGHSSPALYNVHQKYSVIRTTGVPLIVSVRDPRDVIVSAAHYNASKRCENVKDLIRSYAKGPFHLDWFDDYISNRNEKDHFCVKYEDLHLNGVQLLNSLLSWLGVKCDQDKILETYNKWTVEKTRSVTNPVLVRNGRAGEWVNFLSDKEILHIRDKMGFHLKTLGYK